MAENYVQLPLDGIGKKLRTRNRTVGANDVHEQAVYNVSDPTYFIWTGSLALAQNKLLLSFLNNSGSGQVIRVRKLYVINTAIAAVTGVMLQQDLKRISAISGGTGVTPNPVDTTDGALTNVTCVHTATSATEGIVLFPWYTTNDEIGVTNAFPTGMIQATNSILPEGNEVKELVLNPGEGFCVKQITNTTVGGVGILAVVTKG